MILLNLSIWSSPPDLYVIIDYHSSTLFKPKEKKKSVVCASNAVYIYPHIYCFLCLPFFWAPSIWNWFPFVWNPSFEFFKMYISFVTNFHTFLHLTACFYFVLFLQIYFCSLYNSILTYIFSHHTKSFHCFLFFYFI